MSDAAPTHSSHLDHAILQALSEGVIVRRKSGEVIHFNPAAERILGLTVGELTGADPLPRAWYLMDESGDRMPMSAHPAMEVFRTGQPVSRRLGVHQPTGDTVWVDSTSQPAPPTIDGHEELVITTMADVTVAREAKHQLLENRERIQAVTETAPVGIFTTDPNGLCTYVNPQWERIFDLPAEEALGEGWSSTVHPEDRSEVARLWRDAASAGKDMHLHFRVRHRDGSDHWVRAGTRAIVDASGAIGGHVGTVEDVNAEISNRDALRAVEQRFRVAFENAPLGMMEISPTDCVVSANAATAQLLGRSIDEIVGANACAVLGFADRSELMQAGKDPLVHALDGSNAHRIELPGGEHRFLLLRVASLSDNHYSSQPSLLVQMADITERLRFEDRLRHLANHDPLTGLMNRRSFSEVLDHHTVRVKRHGATGALLIVDLDNFKAVNDTLGHGAGDVVITTVARALQRRLREEDHIARLGGDELAILATTCDTEHAATLARAVVEAIRREVITLPSGATRRVTASVGVAVFDSEHRSSEALMAAADIALYDAKDAGRDCFVIASHGDQASRVGSSISWIDRVEVALEQEQLELHAQPIVDLATGRVTQQELLIRIIGADGERIPPAPWMAVAESTGLVRKIDRWVCSRAIDLLAATEETAFEVNVSGVSLGDDDLLELIAQGLHERSVDPARLIIEVTETAAIANLGAAQAFIAELRRLGCRFALDDFGAGFGSFYYLKYLPFDFLKIDGEFVRQCDTDSADRSIIRSIVAIARELETAVIAEHVQSTPVLDTVVDLGVSHAQGYLLGAPTAIEIPRAAGIPALP